MSETPDEKQETPPVDDPKAEPGKTAAPAVPDQLIDPMSVNIIPPTPGPYVRVSILRASSSPYIVEWPIEEPEEEP